jgi:hypothetical protein
MVGMPLTVEFGGPEQHQLEPHQDVADSPPGAAQRRKVRGTENLRRDVSLVARRDLNPRPWVMSARGAFRRRAFSERCGQPIIFAHGPKPILSINRGSRCLIVPELVCHE